MDKQEKETGKMGSPAGFIISVVIGLVFCAVLSAIAGKNESLDYSNLIQGITDSIPKQLEWFLMNFTEAQFYASVFAGAGLIIGGILAYILAMKNSRYAGFDICYGSSSLFPWVLASQVLSLALAIFVFSYIDGWKKRASHGWLPLFLSLARRLRWCCSMGRAYPPC